VPKQCKQAKQVRSGTKSVLQNRYLLYLHPIHMMHDLVTTFLSISTEVVDFMPVHILYRGQQ
jgi:hypothetical protein